MGLSGGSKSTSGSAQKWAQPYAKNAATAVENVFSNEQPYIEKTATAVKSTIPGLTDSFKGWQPNVDASQGYYGDVIGGKYLDPSNNPGLASVLNRMRGDVTDDVNAQFSMAGRYGSGAHTGVLTDRLADAEGNILYQNYAQERANQGAAAGAVNDASNQGLAALLQAAGVSAELPFTGTNNLSSALSALFSGGEQKQKSNVLGTLAQVGSAAASAGAFSDRRLKTNIHKIGEFADGLGRYVWTYIWGGPEQEGVMADEVERLRPWALGARVGGFQTVHYGLL